jgi:hypothetical protein
MNWKPGDHFQEIKVLTFDEAQEKLLKEYEKQQSNTGSWMF